MTTVPEREYQNFIITSRYARWMPEEGRRETWQESVNRYMSHMLAKAEQHGWNLQKDEINEMYNAILHGQVLPSMRGMMTAGKALEKDEAAIFNCYYVAVDDPKVFDEICYLLMLGCGIGFSVERQHINQLPTVAEELHPCDTVIPVRDSKRGWASAIRQLISLLYAGEIPSWDLSKIRPAGAPLKTFGGRASGGAPLNELMQYIVEVFKEASGRKLHSLECHDIVCKIAESIIVGGVRRSACLSLSNLSDNRMREAKSGQWYLVAPHRALANNSIAFTETPEVSSFMGCIKDLYDSKSGERGIFNKQAAKRKAEERGMREYDEYGGNACMESILANCQNCNLTEAVIEPGIEIKELERRVRIATKLGTIQTLFTNYRYLRAIWRQRIENDRLLGVSLTGIMDDPFFSGRNKSKRGELGKTLQHLRQSVIDENEKCAKILGIEPAAATTLIKPSGTASKVVGSSPGIHPRLYKQYIGNVRGALHDPTTQLMIDEGVPFEPDVHDPDRTAVFKFPLTSPKEARVMSDVGAIEQLQMAHLYRTNWCDGHNTSCTIHIGEDEWFDVQAWLWRYWDDICGYAFLPRDGHIYTQQPYEPVDDNQWKEVAEKFPEKIRWERLGEYESTDNTLGSQQRECTGTSCAYNP